MAERAESSPSSSRKQQVSLRAQKLSEERLARKRELDRQAQRSARVKTKNHIAHLESRIDVLTRVQGTGNVKGLIDQIEEQRKENESLKATLKTISKLIGNPPENGTIVESRAEVKDEEPRPSAVYDGLETEDVHDEQRSNEQMGLGDSITPNEMVLSNHSSRLGQPDLLPHAYSQSFFPECKAEDGFFGSQMNHAKIGDFTFTVPTADALQHVAALFAQTDWQANSSECCCRQILLSNEMLAQCSRLSLKSTANQRTRDEDIAIRAVIHGWNAVTERYALDPVWQTLRHADATMFSKCFSLTERLSCLRGVCLKLRHQVNPTDQNLEALPYFLLDRPAQRAIQHTPIIDYLVWPGLRERLVFNPHCYCSAKFERMFWPSFRFIWEYDFRDAYIFNRNTGLYQFSAVFLERTGELQSFRMSPKFFAVFPELKADIQEAPPQLEPGSTQFQRDVDGFNLPSQGIDSLPTGFMDGGGFP